MRLARTLAFTLLLGLPLFAQAPKPDFNTGPDVGEAIPEFRLPDQNGQMHALADLAGPKGLALYFTRSADWCPYCKTQMAELNQQLDQFKAQGLNVAVITYDSPAILKKFSDRLSIQYPMLSDEGSKTIRAFDILNPEPQPGNRAYGIPNPGAYIVNPQGVVQSKHFVENYRERLSAASILVENFGLTPGGSVQEVETKHLKLRAAASNATVWPGAQIALVLDVELKDKMHVYAPGIQDYIPVRWTVKSSDTFSVHEATWPESRMLHLPAINETVPVFENGWRASREVTLAGRDVMAPILERGGRVTIEGDFRYQACDDRVCYTPQSIPLKWEFDVKPLDVVRAVEE